MFINNLLLKRFNKIVISINQVIESFFNKIKDLIKTKKKNKPYLKNIDKRIAITSSSIFILILTYFLIPTLYDKNRVKSLLENQIYQKYNLKVKFNDKLRYGLFPRPHFFSENLVASYNEKNLAVLKKAKIYITFGKFFSLEQLSTKKVFFKKNEFNINADTINFFKDILNSNKDEHEIFFVDSKLFYKNDLDEIIFLSKLNNLKFSYNDENLDHKMKLNYEIFNLPFVLDIINNLDKKKTLMKLKSKKIRLNIDNEFNYQKDNIDGSIKTSIMNKEQIFDYEINDKFLEFKSKENDFDGKLYFKPFYLSSNLNLDQLNIKKLLSNNSILTSLLNSELLFNENLSANINFNLNNLSSIYFLNNLNLKIHLEEGNIFIKDSNIDWNQSIEINLDNVQLINENNNTKFVGEIVLNFYDIGRFYSYYQISRSKRKNIKEMKLDFVFNVNQKKINLDNLTIDEKLNKNLNIFLNEFNSKNENIFNKISFRNFVKNFFNNYYEG